jgi:hypothetical protein
MKYYHRQGEEEQRRIVQGIDDLYRCAVARLT